MIPVIEEGHWVDLHSHLVPGVDDGARSVADVLEGVERMWEHGISRVVTTPHLAGSVTLDPALFDDVMERMDRAFAPARDAVAVRFPEFVIDRANEVALDDPEADLTDPRLQLGHGPAVLAEWPRFQEPPQSIAILERLAGEGITVLLAHPERYHVQGVPSGRVERWKEAGALLQVNHGSLAGVYGPEVRDRALDLVARGWVDCLSSDFHGRPTFPLFVDGAWAELQRMAPEAGDAEGIWNLLTRTNPGRILRGERPLPVPPFGREETLWSRMVSIFR